MTILSKHDQAFFETTKRVLAELVNEGLVHATLEVAAPGISQTLCLCSVLHPQDGALVKVAIKVDTFFETKKDRVVSVVRPDSLQTPVTIVKTGDEELDPGTLFKILSTSFSNLADEEVLDAMVQELRNSANNQGEIISTRPALCC